MGAWKRRAGTRQPLAAPVGGRLSPEAKRKGATCQGRIGVGICIDRHARPGSSPNNQIIRGFTAAGAPKDQSCDRREVDSSGNRSVHDLSIRLMGNGRSGSHPSQVAKLSWTPRPVWHESLKVSLQTFRQREISPWARCLQTSIIIVHKRSSACHDETLRSISRSALGPIYWHCNHIDAPESTPVPHRFERRR